MFSLFHSKGFCFVFVFVFSVPSLFKEPINGIDSKIQEIVLC